MTTIISILVLVFSVLQIILFFKVWGMTNNVEKITNYLLKNQNEDSNSVMNTISEEERAAHIGTELKEGVLVRTESDGREMIIMKCLGNDLYSCGDPNTGLTISSYKSHQLELVTE